MKQYILTIVEPDCHWHSANVRILDVDITLTRRWCASSAIPVDETFDFAHPFILDDVAVNKRARETQINGGEKSEIKIVKSITYKIEYHPPCSCLLRLVPRIVHEFTGYTRTQRFLCDTVFAPSNVARETRGTRRNFKDCRINRALAAICMLTRLRRRLFPLEATTNFYADCFLILIPLRRIPVSLIPLPVAFLPRMRMRWLRDFSLGESRPLHENFLVEDLKRKKIPFELASFLGRLTEQRNSSRSGNPFRPVSCQKRGSCKLESKFFFYFLSQFSIQHLLWYFKQSNQFLLKVFYL